MAHWVGGSAGYRVGTIGRGPPIIVAAFAVWLVLENIA